MSQSEIENRIARLEQLHEGISSNVVRLICDSDADEKAQIEERKASGEIVTDTLVIIRMIIDPVHSDKSASQP